MHNLAAILANGLYKNEENEMKVVNFSDFDI